MTRKVFLEKYMLRFLATLTLLGLIVYTVYHVFGNSSGSLLTVPVRRITDVQKVSGVGYLFRDETVLYTDSPGVIDEAVNSGSKVSKNVKLAQVWHTYPADEIDSVQAILDRLNRTIHVLEEGTPPSDDTLADAEAYRARAIACYEEILASVRAGSWSGMEAMEDEMLSMLNRHAALIGKGESAPMLLEELRAQRERLLEGESTTVYNETSSGYFYSRSFVDGLEQSFTAEVAKGLTVKEFEQLKMSEPPSSSGYTVGKMAYGSRWYLAVGFSESAKGLFEEGSEYEFVFTEDARKELTLDCVRVAEDSGGGLVAVFSSDEVPADMRFLRKQTVEITVDTCTGYYVPETALHTVNGAEGVYIFKDSAVYFRRVQVLYRGDGYIIAAENDEQGEDYLNLFDIMVTYGEDLYEGRVYR